jgi:hypothetical protein
LEGSKGRPLTGVSLSFFGQVAQSSGLVGRVDYRDSPQGGCGNLGEILKLTHYRLVHLVLDPFLKAHGYPVTGFFPNCRANIGLYRQHVSPVSPGHKRASEWVTIDRATNLYQSPSLEVFDGIRHNHIRPATFAWVFLKRCCKSLIQHGFIIHAVRTLGCLTPSGCDF